MSSRSSAGARPYCSANFLRATTVRIAARVGASMGAFQCAPTSVVVVAVGHRQGAGEGGFAVADVEPAAQFGGFARREAVHSPLGHIGGDRIGVGVQPFSEKRFHLCFADLGTGLHRPHVGDIVFGHPACAGGLQRGQPGAHPVARGFTFGGVVVDQRGFAARGRIDSGDLPDQVLIPVSGSELVHRHRHCGAVPSTRTLGRRASVCLASL